MFIQYSKSVRGVRFYEVREHGDNIFTGTLGECKRFVLIHNDKVVRRLEMERASRPHLQAS